jgi:hypothetical protein
MYIELETAGQPLLSEAQYHHSGPVAALGDEASDLTHEQMAVNTGPAPASSGSQESKRIMRPGRR